MACFEVAGLGLLVEGSFAQSDRLFDFYSPYRRPSIELPRAVRVTLGAASPRSRSALTLRCDPAWATLSGGRNRRIEVGGAIGFGVVDILLMHAFAGVLAGHGGLIVHGAAVDGPRGAIAFLGPSGAGKTTAARNCPARLLQQDRVAIGIGPSGPWLAPVPFLHGEPRSGDTGRQPLDQLVLIEKASVNSVVHPPPREAVARLLAAVIVPENPAIAAEVLSTVHALTAAVTVRALRARRDGGFWSLLVGPVAPRSEFD